MPRSRLRLDKKLNIQVIGFHPGLVKQWQVEHVHTRHSFIIDTSKKNMYLFWELVGIPCRHVVSALGFMKKYLEDSVVDC